MLGDCEVGDEVFLAEWGVVQGTCDAIGGGHAGRYGRVGGGGRSGGLLADTYSAERVSTACYHGHVEEAFVKGATKALRWWIYV